MHCVLTTEATEVIEHLKQANWFSRLGQPLVGQENEYVLAVDIKMAYDMMAKRKWNEVLVETTNRLREELFPKVAGLKDSRHHPNYNDYVDYIKEIVAPMVRQKVQDAELSDKLLPTMDWLVLFVIFCFQFKEFVQEQFYFEMHQLILNGRLPCGWIGKDYDHGLLVIF